MPVVSDNEFPKFINNAQTSFPTPQTGMVVMRSDINYETFVYDGTRWVSTTPYVFSYGTGNTSVSFSGATFQGYFAGGFDTAGPDYWVESIEVSHAVAGTHDASNYYSVSYFCANVGGSGGAGSGIWTGGTTHAVSPGSSNWQSQKWTTGFLLDVSVENAIAYSHAETGSAGSLRLMGTMILRKIAT